MKKIEKIPFSIHRFNPDKDNKPYMQKYELKITKGSDLMLLTALERIKAELDETLSFRRSCGEGVCGSDGLNINGKNGLACITKVRDLSFPIFVRPLPGFKVIRDLVVNMDQFFKQYERVKPYLQNSSTPPTKERKQLPEDRVKLDGLYECIMCGCCTSACPSAWWNPDKFLGPAALLQSYRFIVDSRDDNTTQRLEDLEDPYSLFRCRTIMNCVDVCPKSLNPTKAINEIKKLMVKKST